MSLKTERLWRRAQQYIASQQSTAATISLESLIAEEPENFPARMLLASVVLSQNRVRQAAEHVKAAAELVPHQADLVSTTAHCLLRIGEMVTARDCLHRFDDSRASDGSMLTALAHAYQMLGEHPKALQLMDHAKSNGFDNPDFRYFRSLQLQFNGRMDDAEKELEACLRLGPTFGRASLTLARMRKQTVESNHLEYIRSQLQTVPKGSQDHASFEFAQFKELQDLGDLDNAFAALQRANRIMYASSRHDVAREAAIFDALIERVDEDFVNQSDGFEMSGPVPIFIVGLPRSGTTLLDRVLDNHSRIISTGERSDMPRQLRWVADRHGQEIVDEELLDRLPELDYAELGQRYLEQTQWRAQGFPYYLDKLPPNYMLVGLIRRALPQAPILHMVRDPMDVCFSNYKAMFGSSYAYSYDTDALVSHYAQYRRLMSHWHTIMPGAVLDVPYADLVTDPETSIRRIASHCGFEHEPGCAQMKRNKTAVDTLSSAQVRQPIHARSLGEWRRYADHLSPLETRLQQILPDT